MLFRFVFVVFAVLATVSATQAQNKTDILDRLSAARSGEIVKDVTIASFADVLKDAGYRAEIVKDTKTPHIRTGLSGYTVQVFFYDCNDSCTAIQFHAGFKKKAGLNLALANRWNNARRYGKAYVDDDGDYVIEFDVDLDGGVAKPYLKEKVLLFERVLAEFDKFNTK